MTVYRVEDKYGRGMYRGVTEYSALDGEIDV